MPTPRHSLPKDGALLWCARSVAFGAALGGALAILGQAIVWLFGGIPESGILPSFLGRVCAVLLTVAGYAAVFLVASLITAPVMRWAAGRAFSVGLATLLATALVFEHVVGVVVRILSGGYVTGGSIAFIWNARESLGRALRTTYVTEFVGVVACGVVVALLGGVYLSKTQRRAGDPERAKRHLRGASLCLAGLVLSFLILPLGTATARNLSSTTPEIALITSLSTTSAWTEESTGSTGDETGFSVSAVPKGPPRWSATQWEHDLGNDHAARPNVLLLVIDSLSTRHMGYLGYDRGVTPNLDRVASRSMRLRRAWATATHSNYAQPAIVSSLFPRRVPWLDQYDKLDYPRVLLHDVFYLAGLQTATISSQDQNWQGILRFEKTRTPTFLWHAPDYEGPRVDIVSERVVPDGVTADRAISWMDEHKAKPFSLYVNFQIAHFPYALPEGESGQFSPAHLPVTANFLGWDAADGQTMMNRYDNAVAYVDAQIGKIDAYLERAGLLDKTIWVITADHGEMLGEHGIVTHGKSLYEPEARVPLIVHYPRSVSPADVDSPVSHLDVLPTIAELAGVAPHPAFQGKSFADPQAHAALRRGVFFNIQGYRMAEGVVCWPWKLWIDRSNGQIVRLVHLGDDPDEERDLASQRPKIARMLSHMLSAQMQAQLDYHAASGRQLRETEHAPRMLTCPALPAR